MALTNKQFENLTNNKVSFKLLSDNGLNDSYYISPLMYLHSIDVKPSCTGAEWKHAVEMANDEDLCPEDATLPVIADGILAFLFAEKLEEVGINLTTYCTYRFHPPNKEFQSKLDKFEALIKEAN